MTPGPPALPVHDLTGMCTAQSQELGGGQVTSPPSSVMSLGQFVACNLEQGFVLRSPPLPLEIINRF